MQHFVCFYIRVDRSQHGFLFTGQYILFTLCTLPWRPCFFLQKGLNILSSERYHVKRLLELTIAQGLTCCHDILNINAPLSYSFVLHANVIEDLDENDGYLKI